MVAPPPTAANAPLVVERTRPPALDPRVTGFGASAAAAADPAEPPVNAIVIPNTPEARQSAAALFARMSAADDRARDRARVRLDGQAPLP